MFTRISSCFLVSSVYFILFSFSFPAVGQKATSVRFDGAGKATLHIHNLEVSKAKVQKAIRLKRGGAPIWKKAPKQDIIDDAVNMSGYGLHRVQLYNRKLYQIRDVAVWKQWVYIPYPGLAEPREELDLAKKHLPIIVFHDAERYFPESLDCLFRYGSRKQCRFLKYPGGAQVAKFKTTSGSVKVPMGGMLKKYLEFNGHAETVLTARSGVSCSTSNLACTVFARDWECLWGERPHNCFTLL